MYATEASNKLCGNTLAHVPGTFWGKVKKSCQNHVYDNIDDDKYMHITIGQQVLRSTQFFVQACWCRKSCINYRTATHWGGRRKSKFIKARVNYLLYSYDHERTYVYPNQWSKWSRGIWQCWEKYG